MRPRSHEQVMTAPGFSCATMLAASRSWFGSSGEKMAEIATADSPFAFISRAARRTASASSGMNGRPSYSWPPSTIHTPPSTRRARSAGQSQKGGNDALAGMAEAQGRDPRELAALYHRVHEMRGADHHGVDALGRQCAGRPQTGERVEDAAPSRPRWSAP